LEDEAILAHSVWATTKANGALKPRCLFISTGNAYFEAFTM
jgi:hypothetical protein